MNQMRIQWRVISTMDEELQTAKFDSRDDADSLGRELMVGVAESNGPPEVRIVREATRVERLPVWVPAVPGKPERKYVPAVTFKKRNDNLEIAEYIVKAEIPAIPETPEKPGYWKMAAIK